MRKWYWAAFAACLAMMGVAFYFQFVRHLEPCPLCIFQRITVIVFGIVFLIAAIHNPKGFGRRVYGFLGAAVALTGIGIATRHLWLQHLPEDQRPECGAGLDYMLDVMPLNKVIHEVFTGSGECGEVVWRFLGLSIPGWTMIAFVGFLLFSLWVLFGKGERRY